MKKIVLAFAVALSFNSAAFAGGVNRSSSWNEIMNSSGIWADFQKIPFGGAFVPVIGICMEGDNFKTIDGVTSCTKWSRQGDSDVCVEEQATALTRSRIYTFERCTEVASGEAGDCRSFITETDVYPTSFEVPVYSTRSNGDGEQRELLFTKRLNLEACL
jgi:hypothetical protein